MLDKMSSLYFLVLLFILSTGEALQCYNCEAQKGKNSGCEHFKEAESSVEHCPQGYACATIVTSNLGIETITRDCSPKDICETAPSRETELNKLVSCKVCHKDLCNSGVFLEWSLVTFAASLLVTRFIN